MLRWGLLALSVWPCRADVQELDFYPVIEYWKAGDFSPNPLCVENPPEAVRVDGYPSRPSAGTMTLSSKLIGEYLNSVRDRTTKDLNYDASSRRISDDWDFVILRAMKGAIAELRTNPSSPLVSLKQQLCKNLPGFPSNSYCYLHGNFSQNVQCATDYEYSRSRGDVMNDLRASLSDMGIPEECLVPVSAGRNPQDLQIQQFVYTPDEIEPSTARSEGRTYYLLLKALDRIARYSELRYLSALDQIDSYKTGESPRAKSPSDSGSSASSGTRHKSSSIGFHNLFRDSEIFEEIIPEWKVERVLLINEPRFKGGPTLRLPFGVLASRGSDLLVVLRRPGTTYEARLALYNQQSFKYLFNFTGEVHSGGATLFTTMSGALQIAIESFLSGLEKPKLPISIMFTSAGLPSNAGALLLASEIDKVLKYKLGSDNVKVNVVTFGSSYASDKLFVDGIRRSIEVRNIIMQGDSSDLTTCDVVYSCDERTLSARTGIETGIEYSYVPIPGRQMIPLSALAKYGDEWAAESVVLQLAAIEDCAYQCYFAKTYCGWDQDSRCDRSTCPSLIAI